MKNNGRKIYYGAIGLLYGVALLIGGFYVLHRIDYSQNQKENTYLIGASYMTMNNEFYRILGEEISHRVEAEGDRLVLRDPALDAKRQAEQIEEMLEMDIDVLVLTPVEWEGLTSILEKAKEKGVRIVVVDSNVKEDELVDCTITSDNYNAGCLVGEYFLQQGGGKLIVMTHEAARSGQERVRGFLDTIAGHDGIEIVESIECEGQLEIAMPKITEAIQEGIEFDNVFCLNDLASVGVAAALDENQMLDRVGIYGVDASPDSKALIYEGMMKATAAQFPSRIGREAADIIYQLLQGGKVERNILVPVELVTQENVTKYSVDRWQ